MRSLPPPSRSLTAHPDDRPAGSVFDVFTLLRWSAARLVIRGADALARS